MDLRDLIEYENENTNLDFKAVPYKKEMFGELLKDIIAMANADTKDDRFIVVGVKHYPDGRRDILGVEEFMDEATYQKLVNDNIEPELSFEYSAFDLDDKKVGYFRIYNCIDQPYMLKKDYGTFKRGESFVRKGSFQTRLVRKDIDRIFLNKSKKCDFENLVRVRVDYSANKEVGVCEAKAFILPSEEARIRIEDLIKKKEKELENLNRNRNRRLEGPLAGLEETFSAMMLPSFADGLDISFGPYENRSLKALRENIEKVAETYREDDAYCVFEEQSNKLNFELYNEGDQYIEDVSLEITIQGNFDFLIATEKYIKPSSFGPTLPLPQWGRLEYPEVIESNNKYAIYSTVGQLKHGIPSKAFVTPIRVFLPSGSSGEKLLVNMKIFGANIATYINKTLEIDVL